MKLGFVVDFLFDISEIDFSILIVSIKVLFGRDEFCFLKRLFNNYIGEFRLFFCWSWDISGGRWGFF